MPSQQSSAFPYPSQRVVVFRHGERRDNHPDAPAESNPPLTEAGIVAVGGSAARLKHYLGEEAARNAVLIVSPFLRTVQTAEALQAHGVGTDHAMVIDNTLCEVFGPSRIKTGRAPQLQAPVAVRAVGGLPMWGESLETATQRYVANFLRNGDLYGGLLASGATDASLRLREESQISSSLVCPAAVTRRTGTAAAESRTAAVAAAAAAAPARPDSALASTTMSGRPRDVVLVTHGDAVSAVLSHFYPARVVYEADFLSFIIMRRYGVGNHVYHLDESAGVNWFVEGIDGEPQDPTLRALEAEREAAMAAAAAGRNGGAAQTSHRHHDSASDEYGDDVDDDEGEALDDEVAEEAQPSSFAGSRMKSRTSRLPPRRTQARAAANNNNNNHNPHDHDPGNTAGGTEASTSHNVLPPTQVHAALHAGGHPPAARARRRTSASASSNGSNGVATGVGVSGSTRGSGGTAPARTANAGGVHTSKHHPKVGEDCERIRLPGGTPAQSSSSRVVTTAVDDTHPRRGHSSSPTPSGGGRSDGRDDNVEEGRDVVARKGVGTTWTPPPASQYDDGANSAPLKVGEGTALEASTLGMSSYGGLTADPSTSSWLRSKANSVTYYSTVAVQEKPPGEAQTVREPPVGAAAVVDPLTNALSGAAGAARSTFATPITLTDPPLSHHHSSSCAAVAPAIASTGAAEGGGCPMCGAVPPTHLAEASFGASTTAAGRAVHPEDQGEAFRRLQEFLMRPTVKSDEVSFGLFISVVFRVVTLILIVGQLLVSGEGTARRLYLLLALAWEVVSAVLMMLTCYTELQRVRQVRRAIEQLRCGSCTDRWRGVRATHVQVVVDAATAQQQIAEASSIQELLDAYSARHSEGTFSGDVSRYGCCATIACSYVRSSAATLLRMASLFLVAFFGAQLGGMRAAWVFSDLLPLYCSVGGAIVTFFYFLTVVTYICVDNLLIDGLIEDP